MFDKYVIYFSCIYPQLEMMQLEIKYRRKIYIYLYL